MLPKRIVCQRCESYLFRSRSLISSSRIHFSSADHTAQFLSTMALPSPASWGTESNSPFLKHRTSANTPPGTLIRVLYQRISIRQLWTDTWRDVCHDLRNVKWRRGMLWFCFFFWTCGLLAMVVVLAIFSTVLYSDSSSACQPDGAFSYVTGRYKAWDASGFFQITLGFGALTFTQVKVIDIIWDIVSEPLTSVYIKNLRNNMATIDSGSAGPGDSCICVLESVFRLRHNFHGVVSGYL